MTEQETVALMKAIVRMIGDEKQPLLERIRKLEDRASDLEHQLKVKQR
jgi:hypothetical protein